jgi:hypothetical protein
MLPKSEVRIPGRAERTRVAVNGKLAELQNAVQKIFTVVHHCGNALGQACFRANYGGMRGIQ